MADAGATGARGRPSIALPRLRSGWPGRWVLVLGLVLVALVLVGYPVLAVVRAVLQDGGSGIASGLDAVTLTAVGNSLVTAAMVTVLAVAAGTAAAFLTERSSAPGRRWLRLALLLPLVVPGFVVTLGWVGAYAPGGLLDQAIGVSWPGLYGPVGIVLVLAVESMPLAYLVIAGGLRSRVEPDMERAARAAGAGPWEAARTITLPLIRPQIAAAAVLVFVASMGAFAVPVVLGRPAGFATITTRIYQDLAFSAQPEAFARVLVLSCGLMLLALLAAGAAGAALPTQELTRTGGPAGHVERRAGAGPGQRPPWPGC